MWNKYLGALNSFIESFPAQETVLRAAIKAADYEAVSKCLAAIGEILASIYADNMAAQCKRQNNNIKNARHEILEAYLEYFLTITTVLSIDIQTFSSALLMPRLRRANQGLRTAKKIFPNSLL